MPTRTANNSNSLFSKKFWESTNDTEIATTAFSIGGGVAGYSFEAGLLAADSALEAALKSRVLLASSVSTIHLAFSTAVKAVVTTKVSKKLSSNQRHLFLAAMVATIGLTTFTGATDLASSASFAYSLYRESAAAAKIANAYSLATYAKNASNATYCLSLFSSGVMKICSSLNIAEAAYKIFHKEKSK